MLTSTPPHIALLRVAGALIASSALLAGCANTPAPTQPVPQEDTVEINDLADLDAVAIIDRLDATPISERPDGLSASITPDALVLTDDAGHERAVPMPADTVYVALAPYARQTHDCHFHAPVGCIGELRNTDVEVRITDTESGETYVDEESRTFDNGFVGVWLPRDVTAETVVTANGRSATDTISTVGDDAATCITTLRLV